MTARYRLIYLPKSGETSVSVISYDYINDAKERFQLLGAQGEIVFMTLVQWLPGECRWKMLDHWVDYDGTQAMLAESADNNMVAA